MNVTWRVFFIHGRVIVDGKIQWRKELVHALAIPDVGMHRRIEEKDLRELHLDFAVAEVRYVRKSEDEESKR